MNTVSWFLWLTHVVPSVGVVGATLAVLSGFAVVFFMFHIIEATGEDRMLLRFMKLAIVAFFIGVVVRVVTPTEQVMYMIAASELGEQVLDTPEARAIYQDIRNVLQSYTREVTE